MLSAPSSQTAATLHGSAVPADGCCLVVQMPSVEQMRREVADITCQMQSVYLDDETEGSPKQLTNYIENQTHSNEKGSFSNQNTNFGTLCSGTAFSDRIQETKLNGTRATKSNSICRIGGTTNEMVKDFPIQASVSSSLPREEQVLEEFMINGKRYRQTYQRRVVLERKTTRDVFFLPASSGDIMTAQSPEKSLEYSSPSFTNPKWAHTASGTCPTSESESEGRPRLDLAVIHNQADTKDNASCLTPTVIMRAVQSVPAKKNNTPSKESIDNEEDMSHHLHTTNDGFFGHKVNNNKVNRMSIKETPAKPRRSRSKYVVREMVDVIKKQVATNVRRSKSFLLTKEENVRNGKSTGGYSPRVTLPSNNVDLPKQSKINVQPEIVGYMYKFGVWDDQAPVLDPRLPVAIHSSIISHEGLNGTVVANPPEWHHAEVGLGDSGSALVRGRVVACLQRFKQHSLSSGKALHRSTYVQQTRIVRQRNQDKRPSPGSDESCVLTMNSFQEQTKQEMKISSSSQCQDRFSIAAHYDKCSSDRLQLLQSLCPAAAAATILLGKQFSTNHDTNSDSDSETNGLEENAHIDETRVLVSASSWCPAPLIAEDISPYIVLSHTEQSSDTEPSSLNNDTSVEAPQLLIRGGTLDGLIAYALTVLEHQSKAPPLDLLFPNVFRVTYPTFTTPDRVIERLILTYVAHAPIEPGCQTQNWSKALNAAQFLVTIVNDFQPEQLTAGIVLRLARFARLLIHDGNLFADRIQRNNNFTTKEHAINFSKSTEHCIQHKALADQLLSKLPLLSVRAQLRERFIPQTNAGSMRYRRNSSHIPTEKNMNNECDPSLNILWRASTMKPNGAKIETSRSVGFIPKPKTHQHPMTNSSWKLSLKTKTNTQKQTENINALHRAKQIMVADAKAVATEITRMEEEIFSNINFNEFLDVKRLERGEAKTLSRCVDHFNQVTRWARSLLLVLAPKLGDLCEQMPVNQPSTSNAEGEFTKNIDKTHIILNELLQDELASSNTLAESSTVDQDITETLNYTYLPPPAGATTDKKNIRLKQLSNINMMFCQMCEVLKHLKDLKNFSSFLALLLAIQEVPDVVLFKKSKSLLAKFSSYMKPPMFSDYRRDLEAASLPYLPYLGLIFQQLIHLHAGNPTFLSGMELPKRLQKLNPMNTSDSKQLLDVMANSDTAEAQFINTWRCWKHYLILGYFIKRKENPDSNRHHLSRNDEIQQMLSGFQDQFPDGILDKAKEELIANVKPKRPFWSNHF